MLTLDVLTPAVNRRGLGKRERRAGIRDPLFLPDTTRKVSKRQVIPNAHSEGLTSLLPREPPPFSVSPNQDTQRHGGRVNGPRPTHGLGLIAHIHADIASHSVRGRGARLGHTFPTSPWPAASCYTRPPVCTTSPSQRRVRCFPFREPLTLGTHARRLPPRTILCIKAVIVVKCRAEQGACREDDPLEHVGLSQIFFDDILELHRA